MPTLELIGMVVAALIAALHGNVIQIGRATWRARV